MSKHYSIYFDMQRNSFYRIDKETGITAKSYLNGQNLPNFKPNVTGFQPRRRKSTLDQNYFGIKHHSRNSSPSKSPTPHLLAKLDLKPIQSDNKNYATISHTKTRLLQSLDSDHRVPVSTTNAFQFQPRTAKYLHETLRNKKQSLSPQLAQSSANKNSTIITNINYTSRNNNDLDHKIKIYQNIVHTKQHNNNSPKKDIIAGNQHKKDILSKLCISKNNFNKQLDNANKQVKINIDMNRRSIHRQHKQQKRKNNLPEQYQVQNQNKKQIRLFRSIEKQLTYEKNQKTIERDLKRKQNLKMLQKSMLSRNSAMQSQIFTTSRDN